MGSTTVWKFESEWPSFGDDFSVTLPVGAEVIHFDADASLRRIRFWARVDPEAGKALSLFRIAGTGHPLGPSVGKHVGTCIDRQFVWHLFLRKG